MRRAGRNVSGPPQKSTGGLMSQPWARVTTTCTATAWNTEAAMSALGTFFDMRFCMSVLLNTPQREAMV